jgi:hypothetical protein
VAYDTRYNPNLRGLAPAEKNYAGFVHLSSRFPLANDKQNNRWKIDCSGDRVPWQQSILPYGSRDK